MISLLSIGIGDYGTATQFDPDVGDLDYGVSDATRFGEVVNATLSVGSSRTLTSVSPPEERATRLNVIRSVIEVTRGPESIGMIYFAGHGLDVNGSLHLCPEDYDPRVSEHSSISVSFLVSTLAANTAWSLIVIDACRSAGEPTRRRALTRGSDRTGVVYVADNVCILLGCSNGEQAVEAPSVNGEPAGGLFTHFFCTNLLATAPSRRRVNLADLFLRVQSDTSDYAVTELRHRQTPRAVGLSPHDVYLTLNRHRRSGDPLPVHPLASGTDKDPPPLSFSESLVSIVD